MRQVQEQSEGIKNQEENINLPCRKSINDEILKNVNTTSRDSKYFQHIKMLLTMYGTRSRAAGVQRICMAV